MQADATAGRTTTAPRLAPPLKCSAFVLSRDRRRLWRGRDWIPLSIAPPGPSCESHLTPTPTAPAGKRAHNRPQGPRAGLEPSPSSRIPRQSSRGNSPSPPLDRTSISPPVGQASSSGPGGDPCLYRSLVISSEPAWTPFAPLPSQAAPCGTEVASRGHCARIPVLTDLPSRNAFSQRGWSGTLGLPMKCG